MTANNAASPPPWDDDDLPEWTDEQIDRAQFSVGGVVVRPATGTLTRATVPPGYVIPPPGRPPERDAPKRQVTLRLDGDVLDRFKAGGKGWQTRINAALRGVVGL